MGVCGQLLLRLAEENHKTSVRKCTMYIAMVPGVGSCDFHEDGQC
jgi:hypothetical protein